MTTTTALTPPTLKSDWRAPVMSAYVVILLAFGGGAGWATVSKIESAAISQGIIIAQTNKKTVQHLEGGIVREIFVRDGDNVQEGDLLLRLDDTPAKASLDMIRNQQLAARIKEARLVSERDQLPMIKMPPDLAALTSDKSLKKILEDQNSNMRERSAYLKSQVDVLNARVAQYEQEISALKNDAESARQQLITIDQELGGLRQLLAKQLVPLSRVASLERERIRLQGVLERAISDGKKAGQSIQETKLTIIQTKNQFQQQIASDIVDAGKEIADLQEKERIAKDVLSRTEIKAPRTGIVQSMKFFTIGAVVRPGETILEIAPTGDQLTINVRISPTDIDSTSEGLRAEIRFPTFHTRRVPYMYGILKSISYDRVADPQNPTETYFQGEVTVRAADIPSDVKDKLKPGVPADVIIVTGEQTPVDYFLAPLFDRLGRGLRER